MKTILTMTTLIAGLTIFVAAATAGEHSGIWRLNPAKSKYSPGPGLKNLTENIALDEKSYRLMLTEQRRMGRLTQFWHSIRPQPNHERLRSVSHLAKRS